MAYIVLAVDLCFHETASDYNDRLTELKDTYQILDEARRQSSTAGAFLDSLIDMLRRHKVSFSLRGEHKAVHSVCDGGVGDNSLAPM